MAKKSSTIHIENCFWDLIDDYKKTHDMSSRNTAIECILSEYKALKSLKSPFLSESENSKYEVQTNIQKRNDEMYNKIKQMEDDMPD